MKKARHYIVVVMVFFLIACIDADAQHAVFLELLGSGGLYSLNYERELGQTFRARVGVGFYNTEDKSQGLKENVLTVPLLINYDFRKNKSNHFEIGAGFVFGNERKSYSYGYEYNKAITVATAFIGYRYQKGKKGFLWHAGLTPLYSITNGDFWLSIGVGFGYHF